VILAGLGGGHRVGRVGAFHQTGRTGLIAGVMLCRRGAAAPSKTCFAT
jgi:hypothetical protein